MEKVYANKQALAKAQRAEEEWAGDSVLGKEKGKRKGRACYRCGTQGHDPSTCTNERVCYRCMKPGHLSKECPRGANARLHNLQKVE